MTYSLQANFTAPYESLTNAESLDSSKGVQTGSMTVIKADGYADLQGSCLRLYKQSTPALGDLGAYSNSITATLGSTLTVRCRNISNDDVNILPLTGSYAGFFNNASVAANNRIFTLWMSGGNVGRFNVRSMDGSGNIVDSAILQQYGTGEMYEYAVVLGGYNSSGVPYQTGDPATFTYGASFFLRGGEYTTTRLVWRSKNYNSGKLYAGITNYTADCEYHDFNVQDAVTANIPLPVYYSATPALNDTFAHPADCLIGFTVNTLPSSSSIQIAFRRLDASNYLQVLISYDGSVIWKKVVGGVSTTIGTATTGSVTNGKRIIISFDGNRNSCHVSSESAAVGDGTETTLSAQTGGKIGSLGVGAVISKLEVYSIVPSVDPISAEFGAYNIYRITDNASASTLRNSLISEIWSGNGFPSSGANSVATSVTDPLATYSLSPSNILRVDQFTIAIPNGSGGTGDTRYPYLWRPTTVTSINKLVIFHCGHTADATAWNLSYQGQFVKELVQAGYTVCGVFMPPGNVTAHNALPYPTDLLNPLRYFIDPVIRAINQLETESFSAIYMVGMSGGGWTTNMCAALDERIIKSNAHASGFPCYMIEFNRDYEQWLPGLGVQRLDYVDLYIMSTTSSRKMKLSYDATEALFDQATYNASLQQFGPTLVSTATSMGGEASLYWDADSTHEYSSATRTVILNFFAEADNIGRSTWKICLPLVF